MGDKKYIEVTEFIENLHEAYHNNTYKDYLVFNGGISKAKMIAREMPTADVEEVKHGYWIMDWDDLWPEDSQLICSICRGRQPMTINDDNYCPKCGAKMSKKEKI